MSDKPYSKAAYKAASDADLSGWAPFYVLDAAHDPALGLDRSVCLGDVVAFVRAHVAESYQLVADAVERQFAPATDAASAGGTR